MQIKDLYKKEVVPKLMEDFGYKNKMAVPRLEKITINVGMGRGLKESGYREAVEATLRKITGQAPVSTKARKSISSFKIREGMDIGMKVTLRGQRMYDFFERFVNVVLPRVRDFRGIDPKGVDKNGNLSVGIRESYAFPEISAEEIETVHPLEVVMTTSASSRDEGLALFRYMGFPFKTK
jgi:large subunit ribosomal protein L5